MFTGLFLLVPTLHVIVKLSFYVFKRRVKLRSVSLANKFSSESSRIPQLLNQRTNLFMEVKNM